jgi:hypothetical protein
MKINTLVNELFLLLGAGNMGFPVLLRVPLAPAFTNPIQLPFFVSCQIQREISDFLNFNFYYVNICEQVNCGCGFHPILCLGTPHFISNPLGPNAPGRWVNTQWGGFKPTNNSKAINKTRTPILSLRKRLYLGDYHLRLQFRQLHFSLKIVDNIEIK